MSKKTKNDKRMIYDIIRDWASIVNKLEERNKVSTYGGRSIGVDSL